MSQTCNRCNRIVHQACQSETESADCAMATAMARRSERMTAMVKRVLVNRNTIAAFNKKVRDEIRKGQK